MRIMHKKAWFYELKNKSKINLSVSYRCNVSSLDMPLVVNKPNGVGIPGIYKEMVVDAKSL